MALTTLAKVKEFMGLAINTHDDLLTRMIDAASAFVENWLGFQVLQHTVVERRDGTGKNELILGEHPIISVTKVSICDREIPESPDYQQYGYRSADWWIILQGDYFPRGRRNITIEYEAGYATVPADIEQAVIDLVTLRYKEKDRLGIQSKTLATETISYFMGDLTPSAKSALYQYKKVVPI